MGGRTEVIGKIYERWNSDPVGVDGALGADQDMALDLFDPAVEVRQVGLIFDTAGVFHGREGLVSAAQELYKAFGTISWMAAEPEEWRDEGDWLLVNLQMVATGDASGIETKTPLTHAWRVGSDGLVTHLHVHESETEALEALPSN